MPLNLYRRHRQECEGGHPEESRSGEFEERKKGWKRCGCFIFASGTLNGTFKRKYTGKTNWDDAKAIVATWETAGSWAGEPPAPSRDPDPPVPDPAPKITIEQGVTAFLAERAESCAPNTMRKNRILLKKFKSYSDHKGYVLIDQWTTMDVRGFRTSWGVAPNSASKYMEIVKAFFAFAVANGWIAASPAKPVKAVKTKASENTKERIPFSDEELKRMFDACETQYGKRPIHWSRDVHHRPAQGETVNYRYKTTGHDLADFISISVYTGLRISDVATFHIDRLLGNGECHVRTTKTGRKVYTWIPDWLQTRIRARAGIHGPLIFGTHRTTDINVITDIWRRKLNRLWGLCGPWKEKPTPHRFRHTFARILLQKPGVTERDVAELLGDTEEMVRKHYSAWMPERQARLTKVLKDAFDEKPKPKIVSIR
jgi:integrase